MIIAYTIGTQEELRRYGGGKFDHNVKLGLCYFAEITAILLSPLLPNSIDDYVFGFLFADVSIRYARGMLNLASDYVRNERKGRKTTHLEKLTYLIEQPGLIGDVREISRNLAQIFTRS